MKTNRINSLIPEFSETIPLPIKPGIIYISEKYRTASHLCCCGCGTKVATPLKPSFWSLTRKGNLVSLYPSIGNWSLPCKSHYFITENRVQWLGSLSDRQIATVKAKDNEDQEKYFNKNLQKKSLWRRFVNWYTSLIR